VRDLPGVLHSAIYGVHVCGFAPNFYTKLPPLRRLPVCRGRAKSLHHFVVLANEHRTLNQVKILERITDRRHSVKAKPQGHIALAAEETKDVCAYQDVLGLWT